MISLGKNTRALLRRSVVMDKVMELKSRQDNVEISQLASSAYNNLQVREKRENGTVEVRDYLFFFQAQ